LAYSRISHNHSYKKSLDYVLKGPGHDGGERNLMVFGIGLKDESVESYYDQFESLMKRKTNAKNLNETRTAIVSFSTTELDPDDQISQYIAAQIAIDISRRGYDGFPCLVAIQNDNLGHKLHMHMIYANVHCETGKGFTDLQTRHNYLRCVTDEVCKKYITPDAGNKTHERRNQNYRGMLERNEKIKRQNETLPPEQQKPLKYIWREDVKERVLKAMQGIKSYKDFSDNLKRNGVRVEFCETRTEGQFFRYILEDTSGFNGNIPNINLHVRSYRLGHEYNIGAVDAEIEKNNSGIIMPDAIEPTSSQSSRQETQESVMPPAQIRDETGSTSLSTSSPIYHGDEDVESPRPRRHSHKTRGKVGTPVQEKSAQVTSSSPKRNLPRREQHDEIIRMVNILNEDAENLQKESSEDIILFEARPKKRNPRRS